MAFFSQKPKQESAKASSEISQKPKKADEEIVSQKARRVVKSNKSSAESSKLPFEVLVSSRVTEKAMRLSEGNSYTFVVSKNATKPQIKKSVEKLYKVRVTKVRASNTKGKSVRFGRVAGKQPDWKKAVVTIQKGQTIQI